MVHIMKRLLHLILSKLRIGQNTTRNTPAHEVVRVGDGFLAKFNMEDWNPDEQHVLRSVATESSNITLYEGKVEHGYALSFVSTQERCPRCNAGTRQYYANFIYATQVAPRVMFAPAGYFCTSCPTVIIDEDMIRSGKTGHFEFQGVLGIDYNGRQEPYFFRTWNGKTAIYLLDEDQIPQGIATYSSSQPQRLIKKRHKSSGKNRMAKESRRRNR